MEGIMGTFANPNLSYQAFIAEAIEDIEAASLLLVGEKYPRAAYLFQQSVEKTCKYVGLTYGAFTPNHLKKISHNPHKVFKKIFASEELKVFGATAKFDSLDALYKKMSAEEKIKSIRLDIESELTSKLIEPAPDQSPLDAYLKYINTNPLTKELYNSIVEELSNSPLYLRPLFEREALKTIELTNRIAVATIVLMGMSFLVENIEENSRYPDHDKGTTPLETYNKESLFIQNLEFFINIQKESIDSIIAHFAQAEGACG